MMKEGYYYAIVDGEEKIVEKRKGLKYPYLSGFCCEREYMLLGRVPKFGELQEMDKTIHHALDASIKLVERDRKVRDYMRKLKYVIESSSYEDITTEFKCKMIKILNNLLKVSKEIEVDEVEAKDE